MHLGARFYDPGLGAWLSPDSIVPTTAKQRAGPDAIAPSAETAFTPLAVDFHEPGLLAKGNQENAFSTKHGAWLQLDKATQRQTKPPRGPNNPQGLDRYSYCLNNPLRYVDPLGHDPDVPPNPEVEATLTWRKDHVNFIWRNPPAWLRSRLFTEEGGTRLLQIQAPHQGANYWHINTNLGGLFQRLNHASIEGLAAKGTSAFVAARATALSAKSAVDAGVTRLLNSDWLAGLARMPVLIVPAFALDTNSFFPCSTIVVDEGF